MKIRKLLWAILFTSLIMLLPSMIHRITNESNNKSVILAGNTTGIIDSKTVEFNYSNKKQLKAAGITAFIIQYEELFNQNTDTNSRITLNELSTDGFEIILQLKSLSYSDELYKKLNLLVENYKINYILMYPGVQTSSNTQLLLQIIKNNHLTIFLMENQEQTGYYDMPGLSQIITGSGYRINRAFSIGSSLLKHTTPREAVPIWLRAVVDRNIRLVVIDPGDLDNKAPASDKLLPVARLQTLLMEKGFSVNTPLKELNTSIPGDLQLIPLVMNLVAALLLLIAYLPLQTKVTLGRLFITVIIISSCIILPIFIERGIAIAFLAALVYPSLANLLVIRYLNSIVTYNADYFKKITNVILIILLICLAGAATVISSMADIRYQMHLINFNLVTPAFILPLLLFAVNYVFSHKSAINNNDLLYFTKNRTTLKIIPYSLFLITTLYLYLARDGNSGLIHASGLELKARQLLEISLYARPRTKEFLIGYPCLFLFVYFYKKGKPTLLSFTTGLLSAITGVSIINSFCHGFTPTAISAARTVEGLLLGLIPGILSIIVISVYKQSFFSKN